MFCYNCGGKIPDDSLFCPKCGANMKKYSNQPINKPKTEPVSQPVEEPKTEAANIPVTMPLTEPVDEIRTEILIETAENPVKPASLNRKAQPQSEQYRGARSEQYRGAQSEQYRNAQADAYKYSQSDSMAMEKPAKKSGKLLPKIAIAIVALALIGGGIFAIRSLPKGSDKDNLYVIHSEDKFSVMTTDNKTIEICDDDGEGNGDNIVAVSPEGDYIAFLCDYDSENKTGTLYRAKYEDEKASEAKEIADLVQGDFRFLSDGSILYISDNEDSLYYYDGKESTFIDENVNKIYVKEGEERFVYLTKDADFDTEGKRFWGVETKDLDDKILLGEHVGKIYSTKDLENIVYTRKTDQKKKTLCVCGFDRDGEVLASDVSMIHAVDGVVYFLVKNGDKVSLYDFVNDDKKTSDAKVKEPEPEYNYTKISKNNANESDYDVLYTSCTQPLYWYGEKNHNYSMQQALKKKWGNANLRKATQEFVDKWADSANEDGYILVTDQVKKDLLNIQKYDDTPNKTWKWLWLCCTRKSNGIYSDSNEYKSAKKTWDEAQARNKLRTRLQDSENDMQLSTLYSYENGELYLCVDDILKSKECEGAILLYNRPDSIEEKLEIKKVENLSDVRNLFRIDEDTVNYVYLPTSEDPLKFSEEASEEYADAFDDDGDEVGLFFTEKYAYLSQPDGSLRVAKIKSEKVGEFSKLEDEAYKVCLKGENLYYATNIDDDYLDLYTSSSGKSTLLAENIQTGTIKVYEDGVVVARQKNDGKKELTVFSAKGKATGLGEDATRCIRANESVLFYINDGTLYSLKGSSSKELQEKVDNIWLKNAMKQLELSDTLNETE